MNRRTSRQALETVDDHGSLKNGFKQTLEAAIKYILDDENVEMRWLFVSSCSFSIRKIRGVSTVNTRLSKILT